jgi:hypothetical protein
MQKTSKKTTKLTDEQRLNLMNMGIDTNHNTTEADVLKVLRHKKFQGFSQKIKV